MADNSPASLQKPPMSVLSVVAFIVSLLGFNIIGVILGAIGLSKVKKTGQRGRGFALAAIWIGLLSLVIILVVTIIRVTSGA